MQVARRSDVDMNGHINNVTYLAWALETVPRDVYYNYELQQVMCCMLNFLVPNEAQSFTDPVCMHAVQSSIVKMHNSAFQMGYQKRQIFSTTLSLTVQMEIDYKAECHSGDAIESLGSSIKEDTNGTGIRRYSAVPVM